MRSASFYRISGNSLMLAALCWAVAVLLLQPGTAHSTAEFIAQVGPRSVISGLLGIVGCVLAAAAIIGLYRHFTGSEPEGWALLGATTGVTGSILNMGAMSLAAISMPGMIRMAHVASQAPAVPTADALIWTLSALAVVGGALMWLCLIPFGVAMLRDPVWSRALAWGAIATGVVEAVGAFVFMNLDLVALLLSLLGFTFLALLGNAMARIPRAPVAKAPAVEPAALV